MWSVHTPLMISDTNGVPKIAAGSASSPLTVTPAALVVIVTVAACIWPTDWASASTGRKSSRTSEASSSEAFSGTWSDVTRFHENRASLAAVAPAGQVVSRSYVPGSRFWNV